VGTTCHRRRREMTRAQEGIVVQSNPKGVVCSRMVPRSTVSSRRRRGSGPQETFPVQDNYELVVTTSNDFADRQRRWPRVHVRIPRIARAFRRDRTPAIIGR
jgi:hypothetical protein